MLVLSLLRCPAAQTSFEAWGVSQQRFGGIDGDMGDGGHKDARTGRKSSSLNTGRCTVLA